MSAISTVFQLLAIFWVAGGAHGTYLKLAKTDLPWANSTRISICGVGANKPCNITYLSSKCDANSSCSGFNTNGYLKYCISNRCGCAVSPISCELSSNDTDLYLKSGQLPPTEWNKSILNSSLFYDGLLTHSQGSKSSVFIFLKLDMLAQLSILIAFKLQDYIIINVEMVHIKQVYHQQCLLLSQTEKKFKML